MGMIKTAQRSEKPFVKQLIMTRNVTIASTAVDAGNTNQTHILRAGLVLGRITSSGKFVAYDAAGTDDGRRDARCILLDQVDLKDGDPGAAATDHIGVVMWIGEAISGHCIGYDAGAAADLAKNAALDNGFIEFATT